MSRQTALWSVAALLGLALTAGITWTTSQLAGQHIGLSSEPISAGARLAPAASGRTTRSRPGQTRTKPRTISTRSTPAKGTLPTRTIGSPTVPDQTLGSASSQPGTSSTPTGTTTQNAVRRRSRSSSDDGGDGQNRQTTRSTEQSGPPNGSSGVNQESARGSAGQSGEGHRDD